MASSFLSGQSALCSLPLVRHEKPGENDKLEAFSVPVQLKILEDYNGNNSKKGTKSGVLGNGMDVYKVSKASIALHQNKVKL